MYACAYLRTYLRIYLHHCCCCCCKCTAPGGKSDNGRHGNTASERASRESSGGREGLARLGDSISIICRFVDSELCDSGRLSLRLQGERESIRLFAGNRFRVYSAAAASRVCTRGDIVGERERGGVHLHFASVCVFADELGVCLRGAYCSVVIYTLRRDFSTNARF